MVIIAVINFNEQVFIEESLGGVPSDFNSSISAKSLVKMKKIKYKNKEVTASQCLRLILDKEYVSETSRIARNKGAIKSGTATINKSISNLYDNEDMIVVAEDVIASLVVVESSDGPSGLSLVLIKPEEFFVDGKSFSKIPISLFKKKTRIKGSLIPVLASMDEVIWNIEASSSDHIECFAEDSKLMNPEFRKKGECKIELVLAMESLINVLKVLKIEHLNESISKSVLPHYKNHSRIPYCHRLDKNLLILKYDDDDVVKASKNKKASLRQNLDVVYCAVDGCNASFCKNDMRHHASWHFIHDPNFMTKSKRDLCGFCAKGKTIHSKTLDTVPGHCSVWNEKGRSFKINANCCNHGFFSLSYKTASKYSRDQPSTNIPIECPLCPGKFYF